jgi:hypothetical protein
MRLVFACVLAWFVIAAAAALASRDASSSPLSVAAPSLALTDS